MKPIIAISSDFTVDKSRERCAVNTDYTNAITEAGGIPAVLPPLSAEDISDALARVDGLLLTGGADINPARYGQEPHEKTKFLNPRREEADIALARTAIDMDLPVLAICLGAQIVNVACGGDLVQDIESQLASPLKHSSVAQPKPMHEVTIDSGTKLHSVLGVSRLETNSSHHQAMRNIGNGLLINAHAPDDIIEGVEAIDKRFVIAVQWHPERMTDRPKHLRLFKALVEAATRRELSE